MDRMKFEVTNAYISEASKIREYHGELYGLCGICPVARAGLRFFVAMHLLVFPDVIEVYYRNQEMPDRYRIVDDITLTKMKNWDRGVKVIAWEVEVESYGKIPG